MNLFRRSSGPAKNADAKKRIFISYRRDDSQAAAGRLFDRLSRHFPDQVFIDVDAMEPGVDFVEKLEAELDKCDAFIAVIGPHWAGAADSGGRQRLNDPADYVRLEIESALRRSIRVIPVLVDGGQMPTHVQLPEPLKPLIRRHAHEISHVRFGADVDRLAASLKEAFGIADPGVPARAPEQAKERTVQAPLSWTDILFSFKGRISRKTFWIGVIGLILVQNALHATLLAIVGGSPWQFLTDPESITLQHKLLQRVGLAFTLWPAMALNLKRMHDFDQGRALFTVQFLVYAVFVLLDVTYPITLADPDATQQAKNDHEMGATVASMVGIVILLMVGSLKGATGTNRFGPAPH